MSPAPVGGASTDDLVRLPTDPYPGLRPFLDHEAALLLGRERQVREVIERMRETHFIAVIGGSGSGKSSLIHAGVVPELRSFGILGAGDFWCPLICTPGTNASADDNGDSVHTPITRLAWRFAQFLKPLGSAEQETLRLARIASVFRQESGFTRLVDTYSDELLTAPGPNVGDLRLLFVIDQFEELFHRTNANNEDARLMVERVIDHFFSPHPRCYVVLTMRSEHLSDCASYLELPDAINKSFYLVRRLDADELREAIVGPAQRFLRLRHRQATRDKTLLPDAVKFDARVVERLLADVNAIAHDPDHLPLLQHLLARLWKEACKREQVEVPARIVWCDLVHAAMADSLVTELPADEDINLLRAGLENWAEAVFARHEKSGQAYLVETMLRHLAFRSRGLYTQQRIEVDDPSLFGADVDTRTTLWGLVEDGFVGSVDYLFWDDENPQRVTLKVSHESFVRGWRRFRVLIDREAERFEEFVSVLRKCALWSENESTELLLGQTELRRLRDADLDGVYANGAMRRSWFKLLLQDSDGVALARYEPRIDQFLAASMARQGAIARGASRLRWSLRVAVVLALLLLPLGLFSFFVQKPVKDLAELYFDAGDGADRAQVAKSYPSFAVAAGVLRPLIEPAKAIVDTSQGTGRAMSAMSAWAFENSQWLPGVASQMRFLTKLKSQAEARVNGTLRELLKSALWVGTGEAAAEALLPDLEVKGEQSCDITDLSGVVVATRKGQLFLRTSNDKAAPRDAIFVTETMAQQATWLELYGARFSGDDVCIAGQQIAARPLLVKPVILIDAQLGYVIVSTDDQSGGRSAVEVIEIDWNPGQDSKTWGFRSRTVTVHNDHDAVERARRHVQRWAGSAGKVTSMSTWRTPGGWSFRVDDQTWRVIAALALPLDTTSSERDWTKLEPAPPQSPCRNLGERLAKGSPGDFSRGSLSTMFAHKENCFQITRVRPASGRPSSGSPGQTAEVPFEEVFISVYPESSASDQDGASLPAPIASLEKFGRFASANEGWVVGKSKELEGWIAVLHPSGSDKNSKYFAIPWSTKALMKLARDIEKDQPKQGPQSDAPH